jgi:hypothetical protein
LRYIRENAIIFILDKGALVALMVNNMFPKQLYSTETVDRNIQIGRWELI